MVKKLWKIKIGRFFWWKKRFGNYCGRGPPGGGGPRRSPGAPRESPWKRKLL